MTSTQLKAQRLTLGLTQAQLAAKLHVHRTTVARWERGHRPLPPWVALVLHPLGEEHPHALP